MVLTEVQGPAGPRRLDSVCFPLQTHHSAIPSETWEPTFPPQSLCHSPQHRRPADAIPFCSGVSFRCVPPSHLPRHQCGFLLVTPPCSAPSRHQNSCGRAVAALWLPQAAPWLPPCIHPSAFLLPVTYFQGSYGRVFRVSHAGADPLASPGSRPLPSPILRPWVRSSHSANLQLPPGR